MKQPKLPGMRGYCSEQLPEPTAIVDPEVLIVHLPGMHLKSANVQLRGLSQGAHWARVGEAKRQRQITGVVLRSKLGLTPPEPPLEVTIVRFGPRELDDDNLAFAAKHVRDEVASWLGIDDRDRRVRWLYEQARGSYGVTIRIAPAMEQKRTVDERSGVAAGQGAFRNVDASEGQQNASNHSCDETGKGKGK